MKALVIIGAGGFARECIWLIQQINAQFPQWEILGLIAPHKPDWNEKIPYLGTDEQAISRLPKACSFCIPIGQPNIRRSIANRYETAGFLPASLIHPAIRLAPNIQLGAGSILCAGSQLTVGINIGRHCIINLNCTIGHEAQIGDFCTLSPGSNLSGNVNIEHDCFIGSGTTVLPGISVVSHSIIGAGALLNQNISQPGTYVGVPARKIKE
ncbi:MAG: acetyltransferase [Bacteroidota bacterium]